jgi:hypothetical protein
MHHVQLAPSTSSSFHTCAHVFQLNEVILGSDCIFGRLTDVFSFPHLSRYLFDMQVDRYEFFMVQDTCSLPRLILRGLLPLARPKSVNLFGLIPVVQGKNITKYEESGDTLMILR